jgi:hypothetical protein
LLSHLFIPPVVFEDFFDGAIMEHAQIRMRALDRYRTIQRKYALRWFLIKGAAFIGCALIIAIFLPTTAFLVCWALQNPYLVAFIALMTAYRHLKNFAYWERRLWPKADPDAGKFIAQIDRWNELNDRIASLGDKTRVR